MMAETEHLASPQGAAKKAGHLTLLLATGLGLGFVPIASGTWGSLGSVGLYVLLERTIPRLGSAFGRDWSQGTLGFLAIHFLFAVIISVLGVRVSESAALHFGESDPGRVVIDEISGQQIVFLGLSPIGWKTLLAGFLLFRLFDVWKPFPARRAEYWPGGWGIMADDWFAALYAAIVLWTVRLARL